MNRQSLLLTLWVAAAALVYGCSGADDTRNPTTPSSSAQTAYSQLEAREAEHHAFAQRTTDARAIRAEATRYASDMGPLMDTMWDLCDDRHEGGMGPHHDWDEMGEMGDLAGSMLDMIERHHARMISLPTIEEMREECDAHHDSMREMMGRIGDSFPGGGMGGHR